MWFKKQVESQPKTLEECIDFTLLDPRAITKDAETLVNIAVKNGYRAVCVNPSLVKTVKEYEENKLHVGLKIVSVIDYPLGAGTLSAKLNQAKQVISDGADELDVVINIGLAKEGNYSQLRTELSRIVRAAKGRVVKAVIETCYLNRDEIKNVCKICLKSKVDYIMTSTGYGTGGATVEDVSLIKEIVGTKCMIKASGGVKSRSAAEELIRAGADLIGTSRVL